jgi:hypothetical protein
MTIVRVLRRNNDLLSKTVHGLAIAPMQDRLGGRPGSRGCGLAAGHCATYGQSEDEQRQQTVDQECLSLVAPTQPRPGER